MPRIDPLSLLKCLSVLLGSSGGIKSKEEVHRLANLMTKFSKKLVSKCIYIQILKTTDTDLLSQFMGAGGWNLVHMWLTDGILAKNWALIQELLELLLLCPVDIERLKSNNCPKLIKGLSKEGSHQGVRILASRLVEQWLKIVKGEAAPNSVPAQIMTISGSVKPCPIPTAIVHPRPSSVISTTQITNSSCGSTSSSNTNSSSCSLSEKNETDKNTPFAQSNSCMAVDETPENEEIEPSSESNYHRISEKTLPVEVNKTTQCLQQKKQSFVVVPGSQASMGVHPVYKITIRDGKQVLTKVETDTSNVNNLPSSDINGDITEEVIQNSREVKISDGQLELADKIDNKLKEELTVSNLSSSQTVSQVSSLVSSKDISETDNVDIKVKDNKDGKQSVISSDSNKSTNDKENRDSSKKDSEKKNSSSLNSNNNISSNSSSSSSITSTTTSSTSSDKKSSHHSSSSSKSSSKHSSSSSSHRSSSNSHRSGSSSSSHRSNSKSTSKDKTKDKEKHHSSSSSSSKHSSSSKSRSERDKEKEKEREKLKKDQAEKDKATLEKVQGPALTSKLGKIPKKKTDDDKSNDVTSKKSSTDSKESKDKDTKKTTSVSTEKKNISISIENRKTSQDLLSRPKTVKTFNSKFRSTGLEEEAKPPPPRLVKKPNSVSDKQKILPAKVSSLKRSSPLRESSSSVDKRARLSIENSVTSSNEEKKGGIKLIPPKPKPMILQESDMFMDALTAASTKNKEPRKRKRRNSISKESGSGPEVKKIDSSNNSENRDTSPPLVSPSATSSNASVKSEDKALVKPNFKFYQDTLEIDEDKDEGKGKTKSEGVSSKAKSENGEEEPEDERDEEEEEEDVDDDDDDADDDVQNKTNKNCKEGNQEEEEEDEERSGTPTPTEENFGEKATDSNQDTAESLQNEVRYVEGLRSVLILQKRKGPKKSLKWKVELESIRYFELDETERVNVTKTFTDMKQIDKQNEREAFQMARKLSNEDLMEEKTRWRALIPIDVPPALVESGKDSREKDIQYAREKGILQALYFHRNMIPDTPAEPEEERLLPVIDAKTIPLDDLTGTKANEKDFTTIPWPDPKPQLPNPQTSQSVPMPNFPYQPYPPNNQHPMIPSMVPPQQAPMGPMPPMQQPMMNPMNQIGPEMVSVPPGGGWRTGDGKVVVPDMPGMNPMSNVSGSGYPQVMEGPMVPPPPPGMMGPPMYNQPDGFMLGPDDMGYSNVPNNFQGPPGPVMYGPGPGPGPNFQGGPRGGGPGPMHVNRGRGAPPGAGWFRGGPPVRGVGWRGGWRGNAKQPPVCRQFSKSGYCRAENKCQFLHPGVNCPPF